jgi:hypothetical protein
VALLLFPPGIRQIRHATRRPERKCIESIAG